MERAQTSTLPAPEDITKRSNAVTFILPRPPPILSPQHAAHVGHGGGGGAPLDRAWRVPVVNVDGQEVARDRSMWLFAGTAIGHTCMAAMLASKRTQALGVLAGDVCVCVCVRLSFSLSLFLVVCLRVTSLSLSLCLSLSLTRARARALALSFCKMCLFVYVCVCFSVCVGLAVLPASAQAMRSWTVDFGSCTFSGDYDGAPLARGGTCPTHSGVLDLRNKGITNSHKYS